MSHRHLPLAAVALLALAGAAHAQEARELDFFSTAEPGYVTGQPSVAQQSRTQDRGPQGGFGSFGAAQTAHTLGY